MSKYTTLKKVFNEGLMSFFRATFDKTRYWRIYHFISDEMFIRLVYRIQFGKKINIKDPKSFNEKLQWLKLNYRKNTHSILVDKCRVKAYVESLIGAKYIIENLGSWQTFDQIDMADLPSKFVLKCNHDSGSIIVCKDKSTLDIKKTRNVLTKGLKNNLFWWGREFPYKQVKPCIFAEKLLEDKADGDLKDYKFFCFNGEVKCFKIDFDRFTNHRANYYDRDGRILDIGEAICPPDFYRVLPLPEKLQEMISLAEKLSKEEPFVRVDFYNVGESIYFGELTFFPASGLSPFIKYESDILLGSWLDLSTIN